LPAEPVLTGVDGWPSGSKAAAGRCEKVCQGVVRLPIRARSCTCCPVCSGKAAAQQPQPRTPQGHKCARSCVQCYDGLLISLNTHAVCAAKSALRRISVHDPGPAQHAQLPKQCH
jgi:hypothetical protein